MNIWSEMYRKAKQVQNSIAGSPLRCLQGINDAAG